MDGPICIWFIADVHEHRWVHLLLILNTVFLKTCFQIGLLYVPVIHEIEVVALSYKCFPEHRNELLVIRLLLKFKFACVVQKVLEFFWIPRAQVFDACDGLLDLNLLILFFLCFGWKTLPRQSTSNEVHQDDAYLLKVVSASLFNAEMRIQTGIPSCSSQRLIIFKGDVSARFGIFVSLGKTEIDNVNYMLLLLNADKKVIRLDVSMQEAILMDILDAL